MTSWRALLVGAGLAFVVTTRPLLTHAAPKAAPLPPLPMLPTIPRVAVEVRKGHVLVTTEVNLPRGDWKSEPLDFYVAFGAPGTPRAIDASLVPVEDGALEPDPSVHGEPLLLDRAPRRPPTAYALLGRETMAGVVVHLRRETLARAFAPGNMAALRVRSVVDMPEDDPSGARSFVVRLGASRGTPLTLACVVVAAPPGTLKLTRVEAKLCGPDAETHPLAVGVTPALASGGEPPIAPVLAVRRPTDDLCVRLWSASP